MVTSWAEGSSFPILPLLLLYHVFLSFRSVDTRNGFTSHLFAALERNGFHTFMDDKRLKFGEYISSQLMRAIEDSRISLIVFSKNYAGSKWCLDELVKIMDCKEAFNQIVIPIFYDVDPSDVSEQRGVVEEAFAMHKKRYREDTLEKWKRALTNAANLPGWDLRKVANGNEAKLINRIIAAVGEIVDPTQGYERHFQISQIRPPIPRRLSPLFPQITERPLCPACRRHAAVLEYLAAEVLKLGNAARDNKKSGIMKRAASFWGRWLLRNKLFIFLLLFFPSLRSQLPLG